MAAKKKEREERLEAGKKVSIKYKVFSAVVLAMCPAPRCWVKYYGYYVPLDVPHSQSMHWATIFSVWREKAKCELWSEDGMAWHGEWGRAGDARSTGRRRYLFS